MMQDAYINYTAVLVAGLIPMVMGFIWYGPLFGKPWMQMVGMTPKMMEEAKKKGMGKKYTLMFFGALVMSYVLAQIVDYSFSATITEGMSVGFWVWLGFVATTMLSSSLFAVKSKPVALFALDSGYYLVCLMLMGALLAVWV